MQITYQGSIQLNKPLSEEAIKVIGGIPYLDDTFTNARMGDQTFEAEEAGRHFDNDLNKVIVALSPLGYVFNGEAEYWGDYEGKLYIEDNNVEDVDISHVGLHEAEDEELIVALEKRGYKVIKEAKTTIDGVDINDIKAGDTIYQQDVYDPDAYFEKKIVKIVDEGEGLVETYEKSINMTRTESVTGLYKEMQ